MSRNKEGKRKQRGVPQPVASKKRQKRSSDYYEDDASDPDEEKHSNRYDVRKLQASMRWSRLPLTEQRCLCRKLRTTSTRCPPTLRTRR
jgi:hypothetical protein